MKGTGLKILGIVGMVLGVGGTLISNIVSEKNMKQTVAEEVAKALSEK